MTASDSTPISPPTVSTTTAPPAPAPAPSTNAEPPISPVSRTGSFPHKTSPAVATRTPFIDTDTPPINEAPVELDGAPTTPDEAKRSRKGSMISPGLGEEDEIEEEFLGEPGERGVGREVREVSTYCSFRVGMYEDEAGE